MCFLVKDKNAAGPVLLLKVTKAWRAVGRTSRAFFGVKCSHFFRVIIDLMVKY